MHRTFLLTALGLCAIGAAAFALDGAERVGAWGGSVFGAFIGLVGAAWLWHTVTYRPNQVMNVTVAGFLLLLAGLLGSALSVRFIPAAQEVVDWRLFIVAYAAGALVPLLAGTVESAGALKAKSVA